MNKRYFRPVKEMKHTFYCDFNKGRLSDIPQEEQDPDPICLEWQDYEFTGFEKLIRDEIEYYDSYDVTEVYPGQWERIYAAALLKGGECEAIAREVDPWVQEAFAKKGVFSIFGL